MNDRSFRCFLAGATDFTGSIDGAVMRGCIICEPLVVNYGTPYESIFYTIDPFLVVTRLFTMINNPYNQRPIPSNIPKE